MHKSIIALALALALPVTVMAGPGEKGGYEDHHAARLEHMTQELGLSADQKTKLEGVFNDSREKFKAIHEQMKKQIEGILTKEQLAKYQELKKQRHEKWKNQREGADAQKAPDQPK